MARKRIFLLGLGLVVLLAVVLGLLVSEPSEDRSSESSTYSVHPVGCRAIYLVLEELGLPARRFLRKFTMLEGHSGVLVVMNPHTMEFSRREIAKLKQWIEAGNRLVLFQGLERETHVSDEETTADGNKKPSVKVRILPRPAGYFGLRLQRTGESGRVSVQVSIPDAPDVRWISVSGALRWREPSKDWTRLAQDTHGPLVIQRTMGSGSVIAVSDPCIASNRELSREDNLKLVLALILADKKPAEILFDEYHHGHVQSDSLAQFVGSSIFSWILVQGLLGLGLFFYSRRAQQAGRFQSLSEPGGRSSMEYVESMAAIFATCKAGSAALEALMNRFTRQFSRRTGASMKNTAGTRPDPASPRIQAGSEEVSRLLEECGQAVESGHDPSRAVALARRLAEARVGLEGARSAYREFRPPR